MTLQDLLKMLNHENMKKLVYRETLSFLGRHLSSDTTTPDLYIPLLPDAALGESHDPTAAVPEHIINEIYQEVEALLEDAEDKTRTLMKKDV